MSANSIPVVMELILDSESVRADMAALSETVKQQMTDVPPIELPLKISDEVSYRIPEIIADAKRDIIPLEIPLRLDTSTIAVQMDEIRSTMASAPPITIPVEFSPVGAGGGGMGAAMEGAVMVGGGAALGSMFGPEGAVLGAEQGMEAEGAEALPELTEGDFNRGPMSKAGQAFARKVGNRPAWYQYGGMGRHAFLGGYVAYRGLRALMGRMNESDLDAQPDLDKQLEAERKDIEDSYGGIKRWLPGGENEYQQQMRDVNEGDRTLDTDKRREADFKQDSAADQQMRHRLGDMNSELGGIGQGTTTQLRTRLAKELQDTVEDANQAIEKFHNDNPAADKGRKLAQAMKDTAQRIYDAQIAALNQQEQVATNAMLSEGTSAEMRTSGDFAGARRNDFEQKITDRYEELKKIDPNRATEFLNVVAPTVDCFQGSVSCRRFLA